MAGDILIGKAVSWANRADTEQHLGRGVGVGEIIARLTDTLILVRTMPYSEHDTEPSYMLILDLTDQTLCFWNNRHEFDHWLDWLCKREPAASAVVSLPWVQH